MAFPKSKIDQDELEEELFYQSILGHCQLLIRVLQSSSIYRFDNERRIFGWFRSFSSCTLVNSFFIQPTQTSATDWEEVQDCSIIYSLQGRRHGNEDRAVARVVKTVDGDVRIFAVMDGHGGEFAADFARKHLIDSVEKKIEQIKYLASTKRKEEKIKYFFKTLGQVPESVKTYLGVTEQEYNRIIPKPRNESSCSENEEKNAGTGNEKSADDKSNMADDVNPEKKSNNQIVLSNRHKSLEELPIPKTPIPPARKPFKENRKTPKIKSKNKKEDSVEKEPEVTDYIGCSGELLYAKLMNDEILKCDKKLLKAAKQANAIGGTTLLLSILDNGSFWVANVGDSRGVYSTETGQAVPLSFDHKPCQLKEKRRIQEAGGFVSLNGVWRVQGVLATSRALGDFPLKEKKVVVADPDILSFNINDHKMEFAVLASDGLWDTHSNEEVIDILRQSDRDSSAVRTLAQDSYTRGSTDNITIILINI
ncbi:probable protein phosphatase 2C 49 isoform X2 [Eurytemora carolleeae]|uniref:probable protein phosphatase 2C 49 isoform X2 n=1 Tax=Eurytemora carolleeae TaxID=1294199 RepID=UPI000C784299|nr:probable protein phosphatase 2C 49 isoform X2 [Eurytemora carolleeae]|eukprot:XP_023327077.1 probable protein phosphatase 2C 49 isoform X2 [Eurytemora affinis]